MRVEFGASTGLDVWLCGKCQNSFTYKRGSKPTVCQKIGCGGRNLVYQGQYGS